MSKLRILVLTSSTGGGHDARAEAFAEWCFRLYRHEVDVRIEQMLEKSSLVNRTGVNLYNRIQRSAPWVHKVFYAVVELLSYINHRDVKLGARYYLEVLRDYKPHLVFSVHDCLNRGEFRTRRLGLDADRFTVFLATGGNGANNHFALLPALQKHADRIQAVLICGKNKETYNELIHWRAQHPEFICYIEGYSETVHLLMQAIDVIVTRGGTTTCAKAL